VAITASRNLAIEPLGANSTFDIQATNTSVFYAGSFVMYSSTTGYGVIPADTSGFLWGGICQRQVTGDTSATPVPRVEIVRGPMILRDYPVTGATAITDQGDQVYCTDNSTLDKSSTSNTKPVGEILRWNSATKCDVLLYAPEASRAMN
jgi:hypothetical protein